MSWHVVVACRGERRIARLRRREELRSIIEAALGAVAWAVFVGVLIFLGAAL